jgi:hypothetical protein
MGIEYNREDEAMNARIDHYKHLISAYKNNDHLIALKMGEYLSSLKPIERNSEEDLVVCYYERVVKHIKRQVSLTNASEVLIALENSYARDYSCEIYEFQ